MPHLRTAPRTQGIPGQQALAARVGFTDPGMPALVAALKRDQGRPLAEHLADFEDSLRDRGMAADRVKRTVARVSAVVQGCRFTVLSDLSAWAVLAFIANLGRSGFPVRACSHYLEAVVQFWQWLIKDGRLTSPPPARRPRG